MGGERDQARRPVRGQPAHSWESDGDELGDSGRRHWAGTEDVVVRLWETTGREGEGL